MAQTCKSEAAITPSQGKSGWVCGSTATRTGTGKVTEAIAAQNKRPAWLKEVARTSRPITEKPPLIAQKIPPNEAIANQTPTLPSSSGQSSPLRWVATALFFNSVLRTAIRSCSSLLHNCASDCRTSLPRHAGASAAAPAHGVRQCRLLCDPCGQRTSTG